MSDERAFIDIKGFFKTKVSHAKPSGYYVRCTQLRNAIERIENLSDSKVIGIVYDGHSEIELILDPPIGDDEE